MHLIGNKRFLAFELIPVQPTWQTRYAPEAAAWAGLAVWIEGVNLCRHTVPGTTELRDYLFVPLGPIADWLVRSFAAIEFEERPALVSGTRDLHHLADQWAQIAPPAELDEDAWVDAREEWWGRHFLQAGADGAYLPNLALARDDEALVLDWRPAAMRDGPEFVSEAGRAAIPWDEGRKALVGLVVTVMAWLREADCFDPFPWAAQEDPLSSALDFRRALELLTGRSLADYERIFGVTEWPDLLQALDLSEQDRDPAASPECQILRDLSPGIGPDLGAVLRELGAQVASHEDGMNERASNARSIALDAARSGWGPEERGYLAAGHLRHELSLNGEPIEDITAVARECGLGYRHMGTRSQHDRMIVGSRESGSPTAFTLATSRTESSWGRRFEAARALGHLVLDPVRAGAIGAASGPFAQETRRRRSGAFAAELLIPEKALLEASGGHLDAAADDVVFESLLERFGVGARTAAFHLWNRNLLSSEVVRDELIDRFRAHA